MPMRKLLHFLVRRYYPTIEISNPSLIPASGPLLLLANHQNSLVDPLVLGIAAKRPLHFLAKAPLFDTPVFGELLRAFGMIPTYRRQDDPSQVSKNLETFSAAVSRLAQGSAVGMFPEGKSHDATKVDTVHTGAARIAIQALQMGVRDLQIVPVGINYERKEKFRSAIWIHVGRPLHVQRFLAKITDEREATRTLTKEIARRLRSAVIHLDEPTWEPFLEDLELLVPNLRRASKDPLQSLRTRHAIARIINFSVEHNRPDVESVAKQILTYKSALETEGLTLHSDIFNLNPAMLFLRRLFGFIRLLFGLLPAALGFVHHAIPFLFVRGLSKLLREPGKMTIALYRLLVGVPSYFLWYWLIRWRMSLYFLPWVAWTWSLLMPWCGLAALSVASRVRRSYGLWWREILILFKRKKLDQLATQRQHITTALTMLTSGYREKFALREFKTEKIQSRLPKRVGYAIAILFGLVITLGIFAYSRRATELALLPQTTSPLNLKADVYQVISDEERFLGALLESLQELENRAHSILAEFDSGKRSFFRQEDDDAVRQLLFSYLSIRSELLRIIWTYKEYKVLPDAALQTRSFLLALTAASGLYELSSKFVTRFAEIPDAIKKLNEAEPLWGIPDGLYNTIARNLQIARDQHLLADAYVAYETVLKGIRGSELITSSPYDTFHKTIVRGRELLKLDSRDASSITEEVTEEATEIMSRGAYKVQAFVSTWLGDTKIRRPREGKPLIQSEQLKDVRLKIKPGDILIERQDWFLSRAFMPGYWAHAAIYAGTAEELRQLGVDKDPRAIAQFAKITDDGSGIVLEAVPAGVRATSFQHCLGVADSAAVLRPKLPADKVKESIIRAFQHIGKKYDFNFDFFSSDKLVCTELVYRSFDHGIHFPLINVMGRMTLPPTELVRKFASEFDSPNAELEFVAFLDGDERKGVASIADAAALAKSVERPSMTWFQP